MTPINPYTQCGHPGCTNGRATGHALYRTSPKGQDFEGRCRDHMNPPPPADVEEFGRMFEEHNGL